MITPEQVVAHYGNKNRAALALGLTPQAIHVWVKNNRVPEIWQYRLMAGFPPPAAARTAPPPGVDPGGPVVDVVEQ